MTEQLNSKASCTVKRHILPHSSGMYMVRILLLSKLAKEGGMYKLQSLKSLVALHLIFNLHSQFQFLLKSDWATNYCSELQPPLGVYFSWFGSQRAINNNLQVSLSSSRYLCHYFDQSSQSPQPKNCRTLFLIQVGMLGCMPLVDQVDMSSSSFTYRILESIFVIIMAHYNYSPPQNYFTKWTRIKSKH